MTAPPTGRDRPRGALLPALLVALTSALPLAAQGPVWVPVLPGSPPGSPAVIEFVAGSSNHRESFVNLRVPGFWREDVLGEDGATYQRITVPGLPTQGEPGLPELPVARFALAVATDADEVELASFTQSNVMLFTDISVYPEPILGEDEEFDPTEDPGPGDTTGSDEQWVAPDPAVYGGASYWPASVGDGPAPVSTLLGPVPGAAVQVHPLRAIPGFGRLQVAGFTQLRFVHEGPLLSLPAMTLPTNGLAGQVFLNWDVADALLPTEEQEYHARYLIVSRPAYASVLPPFVTHKQKLGYDVTVVQTSSTSAGTIRGLVESWYAQGDAGSEHYVLLLGDAAQVPQFPVPLFPGPIVIPSDDPYGLLQGLYSFKKCYLGRLSVDGADDLQAQLTKIMSYELSPEPFGRYDRALLVAHKEDYPGKYTAAHESVRTGSYSHPPQFLTRYGGENEPNFLVMNDIGNEVGVVAYRGHGSTRTWSDWNTLGQNFHVNEVVDLFNDEVMPVVWSISCTNSNIAWTSNDSPGADSIAEAWLEVQDKGAVAHYGATVTTSTKPNHDLDRLLFDTLYDEGVTIHGQLVEVAEFKLQILWFGHKNPWAYMLLGDPAMVVRREVPDTFQILLPPGFAMPDEPGLEFDLPFGVSDSAGAAVGQALVTVFKPSPLAGHGAEIHASFWTDANGQATIPVLPETPGPISWTVRDLEGNVQQGVIDVALGPAWEDLGKALAGTHGEPTLTAVGSLAPNSFAGIYLGGALPNAPAFVCLGLDALSLPFKGGVLVPDVFGGGGLLKPVPTDGAGGRALQTTWPAGVPAGTRVFFQWWIQDPGAPLGFAASNALQGTTP